MSGLYPSLEDMKVDHMARAQSQVPAVALGPGPASPAAGPGWSQPAPPYVVADSPGSYPGSTCSVASLYPSLEDYMGLALNRETIQANMPVVVANPPSGQLERVPPSTAMQVAPVSGNSVGIRKAEIKQGVRQVTLCKDGSGKMGMRVRAVNNGIFVAFVHVGSTAALGNMRFGDQILSVNGTTMAGWTTDAAMKLLRSCPANCIELAVRDRPFERTLTLQKDSAGFVGFVFKENQIVSIVKDSSAARNGLLIEHHLVEVDGQNVVGLKEKDIRNIIDGCGRTVTVTIIPSFIYKHIINSMGSSLIKNLMDHSVPDL